MNILATQERCTSLYPPHIRSSEGLHLTMYITFQTGSEGRKVM
jgi:hypothetical protein